MVIIYIGIWRFIILYLYMDSGNTIFNFYKAYDSVIDITHTFSSLSIQNSDMTWSIISAPGVATGFIYEVYWYDDPYSGISTFFSNIVVRIKSGNPCFYKIPNLPCFSTSTDPYINTAGSSCNICSENTGSCYTSLSGCIFPSCVAGVTPECFCMNNCNDCSKDSSNELVCSRCDSGYSILEVASEYSCTTTCPERYYKDTSSVSTCKKCEINCRVCSNNTICTECNAEYYLKNDKCVSDCGDGYYLSNLTCLGCEYHCKTCRSDTVCIECYSGYYLYDSRCLECESHCDICSSNTVCIQCKIGFYLQNEDCVMRCSGSYYQLNKSCIPCETNCYSCNSDGICTECISGYYLQNGICKLECAEGYYLLDFECLPCEINCISCNRDKECNKCEYGYILKEGICEIKCEDGYFRLNSGCLPCKGNCNLCKDNLICKKCDSGYYLKNGDCVRECGNEYYIDNIECKPCSTGCSRCNSDNKCEECSFDYLVKDHKCVLDCGEGYYSNGRNCNKCSVECKECSSYSVCLEEASSNFLLDNSSQITQALVIILSVLSIVSMNFDNLLSMIGNIQILNNTLLYNFSLPVRTQQVLKGLSVFMYVPSLFDNFITDKETLHDERYERLNIRNELILNNSGKSLTIFLCLILLIILLRIIRNRIRTLSETLRIKKAINKVLLELEWNFIIGFLIQISLELTVSSLINIMYVSFSDTASTIGFCISIIVLVISIQILILISPIKLLLFYLKYYDNIKDNTFDIRYKVLHYIMKSDVLDYLFYNILYLSRRIIYGIVMILLSSSPYIQVVINSSISIGIYYFMIIYKPFKSKLDNYIKLYIELSNAMIQSLIGLFLKQDLPSEIYEVADWAIVIISYSIMILPTLVQVIIMSKDAIIKCRRKKGPDTTEVLANNIISLSFNQRASNINNID